MFRLGRDDVLASLFIEVGLALDAEVVAFRRTGSENDFLWIDALFAASLLRFAVVNCCVTGIGFSGNQRRDLCPRFFDPASHPKAWVFKWGFP